MMAFSKRSGLRTSAVACMLACTLAATSVAAADPVDVLFAEGVAAAQAGQREVAYEKLKAAWQLRQTFDIAASLATVENALGKHRDAAEHFQFALDNFPPMTEGGKREQLQAGLASAKTQVGELKINVAAGATVEVNGKMVGTAPLQSPVYVDAGQATVTCRKKDFGEGKALVEVRIGEAQEVKVEIVIATDQPRGEKALWPFAVFGGVAAAGVGVGIAGIVLNQQHLRDADEAIAALPDGACGATGELCTDISDRLKSSDQFLAMGIAGFAVAGAAGIGALIYGLVPSDAKASEQAFRIVPVFGPTAGAYLEGQF